MEYKIPELNEAQKIKYKTLMRGNNGAFVGMISNQLMDYELNGSPKTYEDVLKINLDYAIINDLLIEKLVEESKVVEVKPKEVKESVKSFIN